MRILGDARRCGRPRAAIKAIEEFNLAVANIVVPPEQATAPIVRSCRAVQEKYLAEISKRFGMSPVQIPLLPRKVKGSAMLAELGEQVYGETSEVLEALEV